MKSLALIASVALLLPVTADARKITYYRDRDGDGHYVKKTVKVSDRHHHSHRSYPRHGYRSYSSRHYGYRPYSYGYYPYYRSYPSVSFVYSSSRPRYYDYEVPSYRSSASLEVAVQRELKRRGYYHGAIDGDIGPGSRSAIRAFQAERGLAITGRIDSSLLRSLGI